AWLLTHHEDAGEGVPLIPAVVIEDHIAGVVFHSSPCLHDENRTVWECPGLGRRGLVVSVNDPHLFVVRTVHHEECLVVGLVVLREPNAILGGCWPRGRCRTGGRLLLERGRAKAQRRQD